MDKKYIIIPGCSDLNRGDQALVWETRKIAENAGYIGNYYLTTEANEPAAQSCSEGLQIIVPVLEHPSRIFKSKENINYNMFLKLKWGIVALWDFIVSLFYFFGLSRRFIKFFISADKRKSLEVFEKSDAVFFKGGGLLQTYGGITSTYSMYFWTFHILLAKRLKKKVYILPNSMGPFDGPLVKWIARKALCKCDLLASRETHTQKEVKDKLGLKMENFPDLAFYLSETQISKECVLKKYNIYTDKKIVAITMRPYRFPKSPNPEMAYEKYKSEMAKFVHWIYQTGYMPVIVEHTLAMNEHENDGACIKSIIERLSLNEYSVISDANLTCRDLKTIYGYCDYIIGTRFHSVIFAISCGVPGIAIAYAGNKTQGIMDDMGLMEYVIQIDDVNCQKLQDKFLNLIKNEAAVKQKISAYLNYTNTQYKALSRCLRK